MKGFQRIRLKPGKSQTVTFCLNTQNLGFHRDGKYVVEPGRFHVWVGGDSRSGLKGEFELIE